MRAKQMAVLSALISVLAIQQGFAQNAGDWQLGLTFQPSLFKMYNDNDWNSEGNKPETPSKFNGLAFGALAEHSLSDRFGVRAELNWSRQRQRYYTNITTQVLLDNSIVYHSALSAKVRLDYLKLPVLAVYNLEIGDGSGLFLKLAAGPQISFCTDYYGKNTHFRYEPQISTVIIDYDSWVYYTVMEPFHYHHDLERFDGTHAIVDKKTEYLFRRLELSAVGEISFQKTFLGSYSISVGARFEQGLTNIENPDVDRIYVTLSGATGGYDVKREPTNTRRIALVVSLSKAFE